jgi:hypothetical protein
VVSVLGVLALIFGGARYRQLHIEKESSKKGLTKGLKKRGLASKSVPSKGRPYFWRGSRVHIDEGGSESVLGVRVPGGINASRRWKNDADCGQGESESEEEADSEMDTEIDCAARQKPSKQEGWVRARPSRSNAPTAPCSNAPTQPNTRPGTRPTTRPGSAIGCAPSDGEDEEARGTVYNEDRMIMANLNQKWKPANRRRTRRPRTHPSGASDGEPSNDDEDRRSAYNEGRMSQKWKPATRQRPTGSFSGQVYPFDADLFGNNFDSDSESDSDIESAASSASIICSAMFEGGGMGGMEGGQGVNKHDPYLRARHQDLQRWVGLTD